MAAADFDEFVTITPRYHYGSGFYFRGSPRPRIGAGIGSFLMNFFRPMLRKAIPAAMDVVSRVASDAAEGQNVKDSFKKHAAAKVADVLGKMVRPQPSQVSISSPAVILSKGKRVAAARRRNATSKVKKQSSVSGSGVKHAGKRKRPKKAGRLKKLKNEDDGRFPALRLM